MIIIIQSYKQHLISQNVIQLKRVKMYARNYKQQTQVGIKAILYKINSPCKKKKIKIMKHEQKKACKGKRQRDTLCKEFLFFSNDNFAII